MKFYLNVTGQLFYGEEHQTVEKVFQRGCGVSFLVDF